MRLVAKFQEKEKAQEFLYYLTQEKCRALLEEDGKDFSVWIYEEDEYERAKKLYDHFIDPSQKIEIKKPEVVVEPQEVPISEDPVFVAQMKDIRKKMLAKALYQNYHTQITRFFVGLCLALLMLNSIGNLFYQNIPQKSQITALESRLLYDKPITSNEQVAWRGIYSILEKPEIKASQMQVEKFTLIREGQFWRLFTPALLHVGFLHYLLNMIWLWILGKQIEERIKKARYFILIVLLGCATNTIQYLFSGPNFMGFSGVVCGLAGFIWAKQRFAPWEGYPVPKNMINFLFIFVFGVAALQLLTLLLTVYGGVSLSIPIGNSAHLSGVLLGILLGYSHLFDRKSK